MVLVAKKPRNHLLRTLHVLYKPCLYEWSSSRLREATAYFPRLNCPIMTDLFKSNCFASCSVPPIRWHLKLSADRSNRRFLEGHEIHKREPAIRCQAFCPSCFKRAHLKSMDIHVLDPGHRGVMDEVAAVVKVIDGGLYVNTSSAAFKLCFLE